MDTLIVMRKPLKKFTKTTKRARSKQKSASRARKGEAEAAGGGGAPGGDAEPCRCRHGLSFVKLYNELCVHNAHCGVRAVGGRGARRERERDGRPNTPAERRSRESLVLLWEGEAGGQAHAHAHDTRTVFHTDYGATNSRV